MKRIVGQRSLQLHCISGRRRHPLFDLVRLRQDHRHRFGMNWHNDGVRFGCQEREIVCRFAFLDLSNGCPVRPKAGEKRERPGFVQRKPIDRLKALCRDACNAGQFHAEYARRAKEVSRLNDATVLRLHAERRAGELLAEMSQRGERAQQGGDKKSKSPPSDFDRDAPPLADLGITKYQSSRWQKTRDQTVRVVPGCTRSSRTPETLRRPESSRQRSNNPRDISTPPPSSLS